jgi:cell division protein FtsB
MNPDPTTEAATPSPGRQRARRRLHDPQQARARRRRFVTWSLFIGAFVLMVNALVGENGYLATLRAEREYDELRTSLTKLRLENQQLLEDTRRLKEDPKALEEAARRKLGMVKPGETLVIIKDRATGSTSVPR